MARRGSKVFGADQMISMAYYGKASTGQPRQGADGPVQSVHWQSKSDRQFTAHRRKTST